jgi:hypothetical protein
MHLLLELLGTPYAYLPSSYRLALMGGSFRATARLLPSLPPFPAEPSVWLSTARRLSTVQTRGMKLVT